MNPLPPIALLLAAVLAGSAGAQTVWRCDGGRVFSDRPCADGEVLAVESEPDAQRRQQAARVAQREIALAEQLRAERLARESAFRASLQPALKGRPHAASRAADPTLSARADPPPQRASRRARAIAADGRTSPATARASR